jgi:hypothetical protein
MLIGMYSCCFQRFLLIGWILRRMVFCLCILVWLIGSLSVVKEWLKSLGILLLLETSFTKTEKKHGRTTAVNMHKTVAYLYLPDFSVFFIHYSFMSFQTFFQHNQLLPTQNHHTTTCCFSFPPLI